MPPYWLTPQQIQKIKEHATWILAFGSFTAWWGWHGLFLNKYKELVQMYRHGQEVPLPPEVQNLANQVLEECKIMPRERRLVQFFTVYGFEVFHAGSTYMRWGGIVGLPHTFGYTSPSFIDRTQIIIQNNSNPSWHSEEGRQLLDSFILSENAKKFAIAREIHMATTSYVYCWALLAALCTHFGLGLPIYVVKRFSLHQLPTSGHVVLYLLCGMLSFTFFAAIKDNLNLHWENYADTQAIKTGPGYLEGGIEYYKKILQRNRAMFTLMGNYGKNVYTANGNDVIWVRTLHIPPTVRLEQLQKGVESVKDT